MPEQTDVILKCDFCTATTLIQNGWTLPANTFRMPELPWDSEGAWLACSTCAALIRADNWDDLLDHVVSKSATRFTRPESEQWLRKALGQCYAELRANVTGPLRKAELSDVPDVME